MEEQPKDRAQDRQYHHHGEDRNSIQHTTCLKHDQSHFQRQHQETQTKKTGNKKVNISDEEGEKNTHLSDTAVLVTSTHRLLRQIRKPWETSSIISGGFPSSMSPTWGQKEEVDRYLQRTKLLWSHLKEENKLQPCGQEKTKVEAKGAGSATPAPSKDNGAKPAQGQLTTLLFGSSKEQAHSKDIGRRCSWGSFDVKAAVTYHTKEMESIFNIQKQDPKRVVVYDEAKDGPDQ
ncbi:uncharacterized protein nufip2 isoform X2 [Seriola aureovittata]|uniref:uncharacterized protein nufip2 isoform X2 n=1 Tax=Seriola aureovittata TaxID=2871759 RepID=UPI0024BEA65C|nr:uncharacterized protein nufip2 isoform X2 [Seriola aureovittata]